MLSQYIEELHRSGQTSIAVRARPSAAQTMIKGVMADGTLKIDVAAPAEHGLANAELVRFLAEEFGVAKTCVEVVSGTSSRKKVVRVTHR